MNTAAIEHLPRVAAGVRYLQGRWQHLAEQLNADGTWFGLDRLEAIQMQGFSAYVTDLYFSEPAYMTWLHCLAAQPNPKQRDIDLITNREFIPKHLQDKDVKLWRPDPEESRGCERRGNEQRTGKCGKRAQ